MHGSDITLVNPESVVALVPTPALSEVALEEPVPQLNFFYNGEMGSAAAESGKIIVGTILLAVVYGIAHDMVTAHVDVRYFTVYHPHLVDSESPVVMALLWGFVATWWMGLIIGGILALATQAASAPRLSAKVVLKRLAVGSIGVYLAAMGTLLMASTFIVGPVQVNGETLDSSIMAILMTHNVSYFLSGIVALSIAVWCIVERGRL